LTRYTPEPTIYNNVFIGAVQRLYPPRNFFPASTAEVKFVDFQGGDLRLSPKSRLKGVSSDRGDPGCHFDRLPS